MYELINTSLPNGLIAGTHGFATVAMTKGLPDLLRGRLETLCAYRHRTGDHGPSYMSENPVNWFHSILPGGEHVVGRIAPEKFDYTGRTNRLARLLVFTRGEMPKAGAGVVLQTAADQLSMKFEGEPRYLEPDAAAEAAFAAMPPPSPDASAWVQLLGKEAGLPTARSFAKLLESNIVSGGRAICFKTSAALDGDGQKLLALFSNLISFLPDGLRDKVQFATYAAAVSGAVTCHLKGFYDADAAFAAATASQPWVDCETRIVHNAELLPTIVDPPEVEICLPPSATQTAPENAVANEPQVGASGHGGAKLRLATRPASAPQVRPRQGTSAPHDMHQPRKGCGIDKTTLGVIIFTVAIVISMGLYFMFDSRRGGQTPPSPQPTKEAGSPLPDLDKENSDEQTNIVGQVKNSSGEQEKKKEKEISDSGQKVTQKAVDPSPAKTEPGAGQEEEQKAKREEEQKAKREQEERRKAEEHAKIAFVDAKSIEIVKSMSSIKLSCPEISVFYYGASGLTNEDVKVKIVMDENVVLEPKEEVISRRKAPNAQFLLWYEKENKKLFWVWYLDKTPTSVFAGSDEWNLREVVFGKCEEFYEVWCKLNEEQHGKGKTTYTFTHTRGVPKATTNDVVSIDRYKPDVSKIEDEIRNLEKNIKSHKDDMTTALKTAITNLENMKKACEMYKKAGQSTHSQPSNENNRDRQRREQSEKEEASGMYVDAKNKIKALNNNTINETAVKDLTDSVSLCDLAKINNAITGIRDLEVKLEKGEDSETKKLTKDLEGWKKKRDSWEEIREDTFVVKEVKWRKD